MKNGTVQVICGSGKGKTSMALGLAISALAEQKRVIMIQFLKGSLEPERMDVLMRLEPDLKVFRFEKSPAFFEHLSEEEKKEEALPNPMEQANKNMMYIMPIMSISIALVAPLGLALYWLVNNILMIIERLVLNKVIKEEEKV